MIKVNIIGLGLIGGSIARDLKSQLNVVVGGVDIVPDNALKAKELDLVHEIYDMGKGYRQCRCYHHRYSCQ